MRCRYYSERAKWSTAITNKPDLHLTPAGWTHTHKPVGSPKHHRQSLWEQMKRREARNRGLL